MNLDSFEALHARMEQDTLDWLERELQSAIDRGEQPCLERTTFLMHCVTYSGSLSISMRSLESRILKDPYLDAWRLKPYLPKDSETLDHRKHRRRK